MGRGNSSSNETLYGDEGSFSTRYSVGETDVEQDRMVEKPPDCATGYPEVLVVVAVVLAITAVAGNLLMERNLKKEMLPLLSGRE